MVGDLCPVWLDIKVNYRKTEEDLHFDMLLDNIRVGGTRMSLV